VDGNRGRYGATMALTNWAQSHTYRACTVHTPSTLEELVQIVAAAPKIRVLGTRHTFSDIGDSDALVSLERIETGVSVDHDRSTVAVGGAIRYGELAEVLRRERLALANLASLPHISVAGAVSTATHGSGDRNGNLATAVAALELVTSAGDLITVRRGDPRFAGTVVGLGALGVITRVVLDLEPAFEVRQRVFEKLRWEALFEHFDAITSSGYSVSVFTVWAQAADQVWVKARATEALPEELFGAVPATVDLHPIAGVDPVNATPQLGVTGPWSERLPHFRMGFAPSSGAEIQSEYIVGRAQAVAAIEAIRGIAGTVRPLLLVSEIRTIAADALWMSPEYERDSVAIHFTFKREPEAVDAALLEVERTLAPFQARPHWGKRFRIGAEEIRPLYPRLDDFAALVAELDPRGAFSNEWLEARVLGRST
jgi:xylitol oxidase